MTNNLYQRFFYIMYIFVKILLHLIDIQWQFLYFSVTIYIDVSSHNSEDFQGVFATDNYPPGWIIIFSVAREIHSLLIPRRAKVKIDRTDASACSLAHFPFSPPKCFSGLRRKAVAVGGVAKWLTYCLSKMIDKVPLEARSRGYPAASCPRT